MTEKSIAIQNMRVQGFDRDAKYDNGSKEIEIHFIVFYNGPDKCIYGVFVSVSSYYCTLPGPGALLQQ